jgi:hypothetical protein
MPRIVLIRTALLTLAAWPALAFALAGPIGTLTIVEGEVHVIRDTQRLRAVEGLRVRADDVISTANEARLVRVEFSDGAVLDLGAATQVLLQPRALAAQPDRAAALYLAQGWIKFASAPSQAGSQAATTPAFASRRLDMPQLAGTAVVRASRDTTLVFLESGRAELIERAEGKAGRTYGLRDGETFARHAAEAGTVAARPTAELLRELPRGFTASLPRRAQRFQAMHVDPGTGAEVAYAEVSTWIDAEPALRPAFVQRFAPMARDRQFRAALVAELRSHPEWMRVLWPEKAKAKATAVARKPGDALAEAAVKTMDAPAGPPGPTPTVPRIDDTTVGALLPLTARLSGAPQWPGTPESVR